ncbi:transposase family protein [Kingella negevensis]|uniref:transposase family protein n=1 Tax=Kingella negevensis TaxID=1522312 RepID=UPI0025434207|nr:transposase family protein [Kingella negevensis]WII94157.1 transposase family protein [Kingella negevensis]
MHSLEEYFARIPDTRRGAGKCYHLAKTLTVIVVAILGGAKGNREIGAFLANNIDELKQYLAWDRDNTPSYEKIRTLLIDLDSNLLGGALKSVL